MSSKFFGKLTGWQIAAMVCAGILAPSGIYAAVTFTNVAVVNPTTGTPALIDAGGSLHNLDIMAQYANNPINKVTIAMPQFVSDGCDSISYTIPAGKALIITSLSGTYYNADGIAYSGIYLMTGPTCGGNIYSKHFTPMPATAGAVVDIDYQYNSGLAIPAGSLSVYSISNAGWLYVHGYLVPSSLVNANSLQQPATPSGVPQKNGPSAK